jgi:DNA-binding NarL/FixJ family response regulator
MAKRYGRGCVWPANCPLNAENWSFLQRKYHFTPRELQTAIAVCRGCNNKQLAKNLDIELNTA